MLINRLQLKTYCNHSYTCRHLNFYKEDRNTHGIKTISLPNVTGQLQGYPQKNQMNLVLSFFIKLNSKWINDFNIKPGNLNLTEEANMICLSSILLFYLRKKTIGCSRTEVKGVAGSAQEKEQLKQHFIANQT